MESAKILVVEDDSDISDIVKEDLGAEGLEMSGAGDGEEALRLFSDERFDVAILDIMLPKIDGWRVLRNDGSVLISRKYDAVKLYKFHYIFNFSP